MSATLHVRGDLEPYLDGLLPPDRAARIAEHLLVCAECRAAHDASKHARALLRALPVAEAPDRLWERIDAGRRRSVVSGDSSGIVDIRRRRTGAGTFRRLAAAIALIVVGGSAGALAVASVRAARWEVARISGAPTIGARAVDGASRVRPGDLIETGVDGRANVRIGDIGETDVAPNSRLRVVATRPSEHRLSLERGSIHARISAPPRLFIVETPMATAIDLGCEYTLDVDSLGASTLRVTLGWVALEDDQRRTLVPMGARAVTRPGYGIGIPVYEDATAALREAARTLEVRPEDEVALSILMTEARRQDAITLWHVLSRVDGRARARLAMRLAVLVAPPRDVRISDAVRLQPRALDRWLEEIEPAWSVIREPAWKRVFDGALEYLSRRDPDGKAPLLAKLIQRRRAQQLRAGA